VRCDDQVVEELCDFGLGLARAAALVVEEGILLIVGMRHAHHVLKGRRPLRAVVVPATEGNATRDGWVDERRGMSRRSSSRRRRAAAATAANGRL
jgi:hypothetical protein